MTVTTKVEGRTYADLSTWGKRFSKRAMKELAGYLASCNLGVTQAVAFANENPATTGTNPIMHNGVLLTSLPIEDDADWDNASSAVTGDALGTTMIDGQMVNMLILAKADGTLQINLDSTGVVLDADIALKLNPWDSSLYAPIATTLVNAAGAVTLGTTDISGIDTTVQLLAAVLPHPDNFSN